MWEKTYWTKMSTLIHFSVCHPDLSIWGLCLCFYLHLADLWNCWVRLSPPGKRVSLPPTDTGSPHTDHALYQVSQIHSQQSQAGFHSSHLLQKPGEMFDFYCSPSPWELLSDENVMAEVCSDAGGRLVIQQMISLLAFEAQELSGRSEVCLRCFVRPVTTVAFGWCRKYLGYLTGR